MSEWNLSDKIWTDNDLNSVIQADDIKEAIRRLKEKFDNFYGKDNGWCKEIDKIFGDKLVGGSQ